MIARLTPELRDAAFRWIADDVDEQTRTELKAILARALGGEPAAVDELTDRMSGPLEFGTAGLRGAVRAGPHGMNTAVVVRTTAGVASWLADNGFLGRTVIIGRDARHGSTEFATAAAEVLAAAGFDAAMLPAPLPTPILAYAVRELRAAAGIQITASHNPPADNGYKLYDESGAQIVPPTDSQIEAAIKAAPGAVSVPRATDFRTLGDEVADGYLAKVAALPTESARDVRIVSTAMHGVGAATLDAALRAAGFTDLHPVRTQAEPDPDFPTVTFPNPEEPGAADQLLALAAERDADLAIALDPDADRCALGVPDRDGNWRMLRGDETGVLLAEHVLSTLDRQLHPDPLVATTIVSASMLAEIAATHEARYTETLTGFKWLARAGDGLVFAYEEALGLCVAPDIVRDKDGISAAVLAAGLAATRKAAGQNLLDLLDELSIRHGVFHTGQVVLRVDELATIGAVMARLRAEPPERLAELPVTTVDLLRGGTELPRTDGLRINGAGVRVVIRPSGTEPKLKAYLQVNEPVAAPAGLSAATERARARLATLHADVERLLHQ